MHWFSSWMIFRVTFAVKLSNKTTFGSTILHSTRDNHWPFPLNYILWPGEFHHLYHRQAIEGTMVVAYQIPYYLPGIIYYQRSYYEIVFYSEWIAHMY